MKLFEMEKNLKIKILSWHMVGEMFKKWNAIISCNYSCKLDFLVEIL